MSQEGAPEQVQESGAEELDIIKKELIGLTLKGALPKLVYQTEQMIPDDSLKVYDYVGMNK